MREEKQIRKEKSSCCSTMASFNFPGNQKEENVFGALEKQRKLKYNGEQKPPIAFVKTVITHIAA